MTITIINIHEAKTHLSRILEEVAAGKEVIIAKRYPLVPGDDAMNTIPWNCYNKFVESTKQIQ
jgi:hypothetical protein